jgi:hypothetical protein
VFRKNLNKSDRKVVFDNMFSIAHLYNSACSYTANPVRINPIFMSVIFHYYKQLTMIAKQNIETTQKDHLSSHDYHNLYIHKNKVYPSNLYGLKYRQLRLLFSIILSLSVWISFVFLPAIRHAISFFSYYSGWTSIMDLTVGIS